VRFPHPSNKSNSRYHSSGIRSLPIYTDRSRITFSSTRIINGSF
jgi:hypothetical protein